MGMFTGTGRQGFMGKEQDILPAPERGLTSSVPIAMTLTSQNLNPLKPEPPPIRPTERENAKINITHEENSSAIFRSPLWRALSLPLLSSCTKEEAEDFLQKHFLEMTKEEKKRLIEKFEQRYLQKYGKKFQISTQEALPDTLWGYGLDLSRCIGCRRCVYACVKENNQSRYKPQLQWIRVLRLKRGNLINLENSEHYYNPDMVPEKGFIYLPVQCQQCQDPPCVKVCPVHATWQEPDGMVVVDYNWCIGCRYCIAACPYKGRVFNWAEPNIPTGGVEYFGPLPWKQTQDEVCCGKVYLLHPAGESRKISGLCGSLPHRNKKIWKPSRPQ